MPVPQTRDLSQANDPTPKYYQIQKELESWILSGELPIGSQVPTEHALCESYKVSRITARKALKLLHEEGVIDRVRGRGSFVRTLPKNPSGAAFSRKSNEIGLVTYLDASHLHSEREDWGLRIIRTLEARLLDHGYHLTPLTITQSPEVTIEPLLARIDAAQGRFAGVVLFGWMGAKWIYQELDRRSIPWLTINPFCKTQTFNFIGVNNHEGAKRVGEAFARQKYQPVMLIGPKLSPTLSVEDKTFGFLHGYITGGLPHDQVEFFDTDIAPSETQIDVLKERLVGPKRPRAIFCQGDLQAAAVLKLALSLKIRVPQELAVVGSTGIALAEHLPTPLTVLAQPMTEVGMQIANLMVKMVEGKLKRVPGVFVPCEIVARQSCPIPEDLLHPQSLEKSPLDVF